LALRVEALRSALKRFNELAIADYRLPRNATRSGNGNTALVSAG